MESIVENIVYVQNLNLHTCIIHPPATPPEMDYVLMWSSTAFPPDLLVCFIDVWVVSVYFNQERGCFVLKKKKKCSNGTADISITL